MYATIPELQNRFEAGAAAYRFGVLSFLIAIILLPGCSIGRKSAGNSVDTTGSSMRSDTNPFQGVSEPDSATAGMERLIANVTRGSNLDDLQVWALKIIGDLVPTHTVDYHTINAVPGFLEELDPQHGDPQRGYGPVASVIWQDGKASVNLTWCGGPGFLWGLEVGKPDYHPPPALPGMEYRKLRPGVFAYSIDASSVKTEIEK